MLHAHAHSLVVFPSFQSKKNQCIVYIPKLLLFRLTIFLRAKDLNKFKCGRAKKICLTLYVMFNVFLDENLTFLKIKVMFVYDMTGFLRTAYQAFAYCIQPKNLNTAYQNGGCYLQGCH